MELDKIESLIGYSFQNKQLLTQALTHPSFSSSHFQAFEFLGDRVLGMVISHLLFHENSSIKSMATRFANLVNTKALLVIAKFWQVHLFLKHDIEVLSSKVLADVVEAIFAAIYLDSDFETVFILIEKLYFSHLLPLAQNVDYKMALQEWAQANVGQLPFYTVESTNGAHHQQTYTMRVEIKNIGQAVGSGLSKTEASKNAAKSLFLSLMVKK